MRSEERAALAWYVIGAYTITWTVWFCSRYYTNDLSVSVGKTTISIPWQMIVLGLGSAGPGVSASLVTWTTEGPSGLRRLWASVKPRRSDLLRVLGVCAILPVIEFVGLSLYFLRGGHVAAVGNPIKWLRLLVLNLPLAPLWEELGWRAYLLRKLESRHSALWSTAIVACVWVPWHWSLHQGQSFEYWVWFLLFAAAFSILLTYVFNSSDGLVPCVFLHGAANATTLYLLAPTMVKYGVSAFRYVAATTVCGAIVTLAWAGRDLNRRKKFGLPEQTLSTASSEVRS